MSFTSALYYPYIEIKGYSELKTALLHWDRLSTIVPQSYEQPYRSEDTKLLQQENILTPVIVHPHMDIVRETSRQTQAFLSRPEGLSILLDQGNQKRGNWHTSRDLERFLIYPEKLGYELASELLDAGYATRRGDMLGVASGIANYYMTLLATNLASHMRLALLTEDQRFDSLANLARREGFFDDDSRKSRSPSAPLDRAAQGALSNLTLQVVKIHENTPVEKILEFRRKHKDELARFRQEMGRLSANLDQDFPSMEAFQQNIKDIYVNEVQPSLNDLKASLNGFNIKNLLSHITTVCFGSSLSFLPGAILQPALGALSTPIAVFAGAGISITASVVSMRVDRKQQLRENPYSYVLQAQKRFGSSE